MTARDFGEAFEAATAKLRGGGPYSPTQVVAMWEQFVGWVEEGYHDNIYEYDNELSVRGFIAKLLVEPSILAHPEFAWVIEAIDALDQRMKAVMTDHPVRRLDDPWWESRLPTIAGAELAEDLQSLYGYTVPRIVS